MDPPCSADLLILKKKKKKKISDFLNIFSIFKKNVPRNFYLKKKTNFLIFLKIKLKLIELI